MSAYERSGFDMQGAVGAAGGSSGAAIDPQSLEPSATGASSQQQLHWEGSWQPVIDSGIQTGVNTGALSGQSMHSFRSLQSVQSTQSRQPLEDLGDPDDWSGQTSALPGISLSALSSLLVL